MSDFTISDPGKIAELVDSINQYSQDFDRLTQQRHDDGEQKYGPGTWLGIDTLQHAIDEVLDLANYARFTYIKLRMLQDQIGKFQADASVAHAQEGYDGPLAKLHTGGVPE
jgi:hypothetical protein